MKEEYVHIQASGKSWTVEQALRMRDELILKYPLERVKYVTDDADVKRIVIKPVREHVCECESTAEAVAVAAALNAAAAVA